MDWKYSVAIAVGFYWVTTLFIGNAVQQKAMAPALGFHAKVFHNLCQTNFDQLEDTAQTECIVRDWHIIQGEEIVRNK